MRKVSRSILLVVFCLAVTMAAGAVCAEVRYSITDIGFYGAYYINNDGMVAGVGLVPGHGLNAFTWQNGQTTILQPLPGNCTFTQVRGLNDSGQTVGTLWMERVEHGVLWDGNTITDLGEGYTQGINNSGVIIGCSDAGSSATGYIRTNGNVTGFNDLLGVNSLQPQYITNSGLVYLTDGPYMSPSGTIWDGTSVTTIEIPGNPSGMNDSGQITGTFLSAASSKSHGFLWDNNVVTELLGLDDTLKYTESNAINSLGQAVGAAIGENDNGLTIEERVACLWQNGVGYNLNDLITPGSQWNLLRAIDINDSGQILGYGRLNGVQRSFILTPVPEPGSLLALVSGFAGLALARRRR